MLTYCLKCKKNIKNIDAKMMTAKMVDLCYHQNVLYVAVKKQKFMKEEETEGLLSNFGMKTALSKILLLNVLF